MELLYVPEPGINLLGRDALSQRGITIRFRDQSGLFVLNEEDAKDINPVVWINEGNRGGLQITPLKTELKEGSEPVRQKQYNISLEGRKGLQPVIDNLSKDGLLEPTTPPFYSPIFPVKKPDGSWRMVCDLRLLNSFVVTRHPVVPNPYTLLGRISPDHSWFSVVDLKDTFWMCPSHEDSRKLLCI